MLCMNWGGAERVTADLVNRWAAKGWHVTLLMLVSAKDWPPFYATDPRVRIIDLGIYGDSRNLAHAARSTWNRIRVLRKAIRESKPDVVASFLPREIGLTYLATRGLKIPVLGCPHSDPAIRDPRLAWRWILRRAYRRVERMVFQTENQRRSFPPGVQRRSLVIPNPVRPPGTNGAAPELQLPTPSILSVGHLIEVKNHRLLLEAFARVAPRFPKWHITIVGEGDLRPALTRRANELGIGDRVQMPGLIKHVHAVMRQADLYVQPSLSEGFSMALCEAMSCGVPVIATDCSDGQRTIVRDGTDGRLVPSDDVTAMAAALEQLMASPEERRRMGANAAHILERFSFDKAMSDWDRAVGGLARGSAS